MELQAEVKVRNSFGLHMRPANMIVRILHSKNSDVFFTYKGMTINAKSIVSILSLLAEKNAKILITVRGDDARETMEALLKAFNRRFGEIL